MSEVNIKSLFDRRPVIKSHAGCGAMANIQARVWRIRLVIIIILLFFNFSSLAQTDLRIIRKFVDDLMMSITGKANFDKYLVFDESISTGDFWIDKEFKRSSTFKKNKINYTPNQYLLYYDINIKNADNVYVKINIENDTNKIYIGRIPEWLKDTSCYKDTSCFKYLSKEEASRIAYETGLETGLSEWKFSFVWKKVNETYLRKDSIILVIETGYYCWTISNILKIDSPEPCLKGNGRSLKIDAISGKVIGKSIIEMDCNY